jgi:hypothetical protein
VSSARPDVAEHVVVHAVAEIGALAVESVAQLGTAASGGAGRQMQRPGAKAEIARAEFGGAFGRRTGAGAMMLAVIGLISFA